MNHPVRVLERAKPLLLSGERFFYCRYDPDVFFTAAPNVSPDITEVTFISIYSDGVAYGIVHPDVLSEFTDQTSVSPFYSFKDFIEVDKDDPAVWG